MPDVLGSRGGTSYLGPLGTPGTGAPCFYTKFNQFGSSVPQLGGGRAIPLGEIQDPAGERFDIQLKGSGRTPFSRGGDGWAWLGPVLRKYLIS